MYVDGVLQDTKYGKLLVNGTDPFIIGATFSSGQVYPYRGGIDELAVFNRALTAAEVQSLFSAGSAGMCRAQYNFSGFLPPVDNWPMVNTAKAGSTIPVKWRLVDSTGAPVTSLASFRSLTSAPIACNSADPADAIEEVVTSSTGGTVLRYDATTSQFIYNWKTEKSVGCRLLQLTLADGTKYPAKLQLK